jgi:hypothetical protein
VQATGGRSGRHLRDAGQPGQRRSADLELIQPFALTASVRRGFSEAGTPA